jgi:DNA gyrase subunit A
LKIQLFSEEAALGTAAKSGSLERRNNMSVEAEKDQVLVVFKDGMGKRVNSSELKLRSRGNKGHHIANPKLDKGDAPVQLVRAIPAGAVNTVLVTAQGMCLRMKTEDIPTHRPTAGGNRLIALNEGDAIVDVAFMGAAPEEAKKAAPATAAQG